MSKGKSMMRIVFDDATNGYDTAKEFDNQK